MVVQRMRQRRLKRQRAKEERLKRQDEENGLWEESGYDDTMLFDYM